MANSIQILVRFRPNRVLAVENIQKMFRRSVRLSCWLVIYQSDNFAGRFLRWEFQEEALLIQLSRIELVID